LGDGDPSHAHVARIAPGFAGVSSRPASCNHGADAAGWLLASPEVAPRVAAATQQTHRARFAGVDLTA
jgi:hypothetical protein